MSKISSRISPRLWVMGAVLTLSLMVAFMAAGTASAQSTSDSGDVVVSGANESSFTLDLSNTAADFGSVSPSGEASSTGVTASTNSGGAFYSIPNQTTATINSNQAWSGDVSAVLPASGAGNSDIPLSALKWDLNGIAADGAGATSFTEAADTSVFGTSSTGTALGTGTVTYDYGYGLEVLYTNTTGLFGTTVTYSASQAA